MYLPQANIIVWLANQLGPQRLTYTMLLATVASNMLPGIEQWSNCSIVAGNTQHGKITTIHGATLLPPTSIIVAGNSCQQQCYMV